MPTLELAPITLATFPSVTFTDRLDLYKANRAEFEVYITGKLSYVHTPSELIALPRPLKWSVITIISISQSANEGPHEMALQLHLLWTPGIVINTLGARTTRL